MSYQILLLEPDNLVAKQCKNYLESNGYKVSWCKNAQDAVNSADSNSPGLVIMELLLTAHSGIEFLYEFRSYNEWRKVPVIIFSRIPRADLPASDNTLKDLGVSAFLYKPDTSLQRLGEKIKAILSTGIL